MRPGIANLHVLARLALATTGGLMLALCVAPRPARAPGATAKADPPPFRRFWGPRFSEPVDGLRLGLRAPGRLPISALTETTFRMECLNSGTDDRALTARWAQLAVYDATGQLVYDSGARLAPYRVRAMSLRDLRTLAPGESLRLPVRVDPVGLQAVAPGAYALEGRLWSPLWDWSGRVLELLNTEEVPRWQGPVLVTPRVPLTLEPG